jgi:prolipoprotein diacylglyceryltransferase
MTLGLDPVAFSILGFPVRWYGLFAATSIAVAYRIVRMLDLTTPTPRAVLKRH